MRREDRMLIKIEILSLSLSLVSDQRRDKRTIGLFEFDHCFIDFSDPIFVKLSKETEHIPRSTSLARLDKMELASFSSLREPREKVNTSRDKQKRSLLRTISLSNILNAHKERERKRRQNTNTCSVTCKTIFSLPCWIVRHSQRCSTYYWPDENRQANLSYAYVQPCEHMLMFVHVLKVTDWTRLVSVADNLWGWTGSAMKRRTRQTPREREIEHVCWACSMFVKYRV